MPTNDPNYSDYNDFHGHDISKLQFADRVISYLDEEWEIFLTDYPIQIQTKVLNIIQESKNLNIPNLAAKIAFEAIPL